MSASEGRGHNMKTRCAAILLGAIIALPTPDAYSQRYGLGLGYATSSAWLFEGLIAPKNVSLHFLYSTQSSGAKGKLVETQLSNYGRTVIGKGSFGTVYSLGVGYILDSILTVNAHFNYAVTTSYTNYSDNRFEDGGYHMTTESSGFGIGGTIGIILGRHWGVFLGGDTDRSFIVGLRIILDSSNQW